MNEEVEEKMMDKARQWSSFVMDDVMLSKVKMKEKLQQLKEDLDEGFDVNEEKIFVYNFISYLHWRLGNREKAFAASKLAEELEKEPSLIIRCNKVLFNIELEQHYRSKELLEEIHNNINHERLQFRATAEIGYYYSRLGPQRHEKAVQLFQRAIEGLAPERNILWEFRIALTLRRQSHIFQMTTAQNYRPEEKNKEAARLLYEILKFPTDKYCRIKARSWVEMSNTLFKGKTLFEIIHTDKEETEKIDDNRCFQEAMKLCPDEYFVLRWYGRYLRYIRELEKSKEMLERSIELRDTTFARHHLALTLKKIVETTTPKPICRRNLHHSSSRNEMRQSKLDLRASRISSMPKAMPEALASLSFDSDKTRSISTGSLRKRGYNLQLNKLDTTTSTKANTDINGNISLTKLENVSKFPFQCRREKDHTTKNQHLMSHQNSVSKYQSDVKDFISKRKSPRFVCVSPDNPKLIQAADHLLRAIKMCQGFDLARHELGLLYRMLDKPDEALKCFSFITSNNCGKPSQYPMTLINAYEQQSICKLDLNSKETDPKKKAELEFDAKKCMWRALSVISRVIGAIPLLKTTNQCFPTLKTLLQKGENSSETTKELAKLHELMDYNEEAIKFYRQIVDVERNDSATIQKLAKNYMKLEDFENAIRTSSLLQYGKDPDISNKSLYVDTCIKGAIDSLKNFDLEEAKIRFLTAYSQIFSHLNVSVTKEEDDESPLDILVLDNCGDDGCCYQKYVMSALELFVQSKYVVNDKDCLPGHRRMDYLKKAMLESHCICMILHENNNDHANGDEFIGLVLEMASMKHRAKILQIRTEGVPPEVPGCKEVVLPSDCRDIVHNDSGQLLLQGKLFSKMLIQISQIFREKTI